MLYEPSNAKALGDLAVWLQRAERIRAQQRCSKNKLYALHAPEVEAPIGQHLSTQ